MRKLYELRNYGVTYPYKKHIEGSLEICKASHNYKNTYNLPDDLLVGVEVEVEKILEVGNGTEPNIWLAKSDGSLRNSGLEFVTNGAIPASTVECRVEDLYKKILPRTADFSDRTSIHVHLDVRPLDANQIMNLFLTYIPFEDLLFDFVGEDRAAGIFCVPLTRTWRIPDCLGFAKELDETYYIANEVTPKYSAMNGESIRRLGSVEFRHLGGTWDYEKVCKWVALLCRMHRWAVTQSTPEILQMISRLNTSSEYGSFIQEVFGDLSGLLMQSDLQRKMERNVSLVKLHSSLNPLRHIKPIRGSPFSNIRMGIISKPPRMVATRSYSPNTIDVPSISYGMAIPSTEPDPNSDYDTEEEEDA
jgi:hypothetical protein